MPDPAAPRLEVTALTRSFGGRVVVEDVSLTVAAGQVTCLLGPSGCGKSTTLRMIAGVERPDGGHVAIDGQAMFAPGVNRPPESRGVGLMFQDFALFPHLTVAGNVAFGLTGDRVAKDRRVAELLEKVNLTGFGPKHPHQLSGGEQQRVAVARALVGDPQVLLADEPTGNLDPRTAAALFEELHAVARERGIAILWATHNETLAKRSDRVLRLQEGTLVDASFA